MELKCFRMGEKYGKEKKSLKLFLSNLDETRKRDSFARSMITKDDKRFLDK